MFSGLPSSPGGVTALVGVAIIIAVISYSKIAVVKPSLSSRKAQQAKAMKEAYSNIENESEWSNRTETRKGGDAPMNAMKISQLWIYPIKSIRGCQVPAALLTREGFHLDRRFMLLKDHEQTPQKLENMHVSHFPSMCLFHTSISGNNLVVTYDPLDSPSDSIEIPLEPKNFRSLNKLPVNMHHSPTTGYDMGPKFNDWLSQRFGFKVILAYWGGNPRPVLGNLPGRPASQGPQSKGPIAKFLCSVPLIGPFLQKDDYIIAFNDCAPYLVISESSVGDVSTRLPDDVEMDLTKFRANVVLKGAGSPYEEDFWGELTFGSESNETRIILTGNCGRCPSLNVDYNTGKTGTGRDGQVLKLLQKDRRVDPGMKYSPIFGRYGFVNKLGEGSILNVGDEVVVTRKNRERTVFYWPGLST